MGSSCIGVNRDTMNLERGVDFDAGSAGVIFDWQRLNYDNFATNLRFSSFCQL